MEIGIELIHIKENIKSLKVLIISGHFHNSMIESIFLRSHCPDLVVIDNEKDKTEYDLNKILQNYPVPRLPIIPITLRELEPNEPVIIKKEKDNTKFYDHYYNKKKRRK